MTKPKCGNGQSCGDTCISAKDTCRAKVDRSTASRLITEATKNSPELVPGWMYVASTTMPLSLYNVQEWQWEVAGRLLEADGTVDKTNGVYNITGKTVKEVSAALSKSTLRREMLADLTPVYLIASGVSEGESGNSLGVVKAQAVSRSSRIEPTFSMVTEKEAKAVINALDRAVLHEESVTYVEWGDKRAIRETTDKLWNLEDKDRSRKPSTPESITQTNNELKAEAVTWAESQGFKPGPVNGFTADQAAAHDLAHPATHKLTGLDSDLIHSAFGNMYDRSGKQSLLAEEAIVNAVEHLSMGDSPQASVLNGLRLAKVLSRTQPKEHQAYVRSDKFASGLLDVIYNRAMKNKDYSTIMAVVRDSTIKSGTVTASGNNFNNSATGG